MNVAFYSCPRIDVLHLLHFDIIKNKSTSMFSNQMLIRFLVQSQIQLQAAAKQKNKNRRHASKYAVGEDIQIVQ